MSTVVNAPCDRGQILAASAGAASAGGGTWILAATILGSSMVFIDGTVVNVALPILQTALGATAVEVQWIVEAYALFLAALLLVGGSLGDLLGRRRIFAAGVVLFTVASMACGLSPNVTALIIARAVQGVGGALLTPGSLAIISASFSSDERGRAIGTWSGFTAITAAIGPVLGGWLVQNASWRWIFFINLPLALIVLAITWTKVPESRDDLAKGIDWKGACLATVGLGAITYGLLTAGSSGLGRIDVLGPLAVGVVALIAFVLVEIRSPAPMVPLHLFRSRAFSGANLLTLLLYAALGGVLFFMPFDLIQVNGYSPTAAGLSFLPFILIMFVLSRWSGGLVTRFGSRPPLVIGPIIAAAGFVLLTRTGTNGSYWTTFFPAIVVLGLGMAISVAPLTTTVMSAVEERHSGLASGINNAVSRTASLLAVAVLGIVVLATFSRSLDQRVAALGLPPEAQQQLKAEHVRLAAAEVPSGLNDEMQASVRAAIDDAFVSGFRLAMLIGAGMALAGALSAGLLIGGEAPAK